MVECVPTPPQGANLSMQLLSCTLLHTVACLQMAKIQLHAWLDPFDFLQSLSFALGTTSLFEAVPRYCALLVTCPAIFNP